MNHKNACHALGCRAVVLDWALFCERHWAMVPSDVQKIVNAVRRPSLFTKHGRLTARCERAVELARTEVLWVQTAGHRRPKDTAFEF